ncbi:unnamed protein product [Arctogadus glacialis]
MEPGWAGWHGDRLRWAPWNHQGKCNRQMRGGSVFSAALLALSDPDTPPARLRYAVTRPPRHGDLLLLGHAPSALLSFTQDRHRPPGAGLSALGRKSRPHGRIPLPAESMVNRRGFLERDG